MRRRVPGLLRQVDRPGRTPHSGPAPPRRTRGRHSVRDASRRRLLRTPAPASVSGEARCPAFDSLSMQSVTASHCRCARARSAHLQDAAMERVKNRAGQNTMRCSGAGERARSTESARQAAAARGNFRTTTSGYIPSTYVVADNEPPAFHRPEGHEFPRDSSGYQLINTPAQIPALVTSKKEVRE